MRALIIVDVQNDFLPGGALPVKEGEEVIPVINAIQPYFSHVFATQDWHPLHHISFASEHQKHPGEIIEYQGQRQELWPMHCVQDTWGAALSNDLDRKKIECFFYKGTSPHIDSYSAFFDNAHGCSTGLGEHLKKQKITHVYLAGLATDYCVYFSALDALDLGFTVFVVENACRGIDLKKGDVRHALEQMAQKGAHLVNLVAPCDFIDHLEHSI